MEAKEEMCNDATAECYELGVEAAKRELYMYALLFFIFQLN